MIVAVPVVDFSSPAAPAIVLPAAIDKMGYALCGCVGVDLGSSLKEHHQSRVELTSFWLLCQALLTWNKQEETKPVPGKI